MGNFSWILAPKKGEPVDPKRRAIENTGPYWLLRPGQEPLYEGCYDGYGTFGGEDVYVEMAKWHGKDDPNSDDRRGIGIGIGIEFKPDPATWNGEYFEGYLTPEFPIKVIGLNPDYTVPDSFDYDDYDASPSDPNQGWADGEAGMLWDIIGMEAPEGVN